MDETSDVEPLSSALIPELTEISSTQALAYVGQLMEQLIHVHEAETAKNGGSRRPSYKEAAEMRTSQALQQRAASDTSCSTGDDSGHSEVVAETASENSDAECHAEAKPIGDDSIDEISHIDSLYRKFWLKEIPPIDIATYLKRFHRYCPSSAATYLTAGSVIYLIAVVAKTLPVSRRNAYRLFSAAFIVSAKLVEDKLYSMKRYSTTAGLKKADMAALEMSLLELINFNLTADREMLISNLQHWAALNETQLEIH